MLSPPWPLAGLDLLDLNVILYHTDGKGDATDGKTGVYGIPGPIQLTCYGLEE